MRKIKEKMPIVLAVLLALPMLLAGALKLSGVPEFHQSFSAMGLPGWFGYFIGLAELLGGVGLLVRRFSALAAMSLVPIMFGAIYFHVVYSVPSAIPAVVLAALAILVAFLNRKNAIWLPFYKAAV